MDAQTKIKAEMFHDLVENSPLRFYDWLRNNMRVDEIRKYLVSRVMQEQGYRLLNAAFHMTPDIAEAFPRYVEHMATLDPDGHEAWLADQERQQAEDMAARDRDAFYDKADEAYESSRDDA